jgi:hypothetical protein
MILFIILSVGRILKLAISTRNYMKYSAFEGKTEESIGI